MFSRRSADQRVKNPNVFKLFLKHGFHGLKLLFLSNSGITFLNDKAEYSKSQYISCVLHILVVFNWLKNNNKKQRKFQNICQNIRN